MSFPALVERWTARARISVLAYLARQYGPVRDAVEEGVPFDVAPWDPVLAATLTGLALAAAPDFGDEVAAELDGAWDPSWGVEYLAAVGLNTARQFNGVTEKRLGALLILPVLERLDAVEDVVGARAGARAQRLAQGHVVNVGNFGRHEAGAKLGARHKVWRTTSALPRAAHRALAGERVEYQERFSNGARWPGDRALPVGERVGCNCRVEVQAS